MSELARIEIKFVDERNRSFTAAWSHAAGNLNGTTLSYTCAACGQDIEVDDLSRLPEIEAYFLRHMHR